MQKIKKRDALCYQLYCRDMNGTFPTAASVLGRASTGITSPEYVAFMRNGYALTGYLKKDENVINENDLEYVLVQIGRTFSVPMAEVLRAYEDPLFSKPHSIISVSVAQKKSEKFICFSDMQDELFQDLKAGTIPMSSWLRTWMSIRKRRETNPPGIWDVNATSIDDCEACFQYPFEVAERWTNKHGLKLIRFDESILNMVMFDILVGQTDRTPGNYGLLVDWELGTASLAPLFDNATLSKPYMSRMLNGFNYLLIDRTAFAATACRKWQAAFLSSAASLLNRKQEIAVILNASSGFVPADKLHFLKNRISESIDILKEIVKSSGEMASPLAMPLGNETRLHAEIKNVFAEHGICPIRIEMLGEMGLEPKYRVDTADRSYFVKFSFYNRFAQELLELMMETLHHTQSVSIPFISRNIPSVNRQINIYSWIDGVVLRQAICTKTESECYQIGIRCGKLLRDIHSTAITLMPDTYNIDDRLAGCLRILSRRDDLLTQRNIYFPHMQKWKELLRRPHQSTLVHMDYVPKNIMISGNALYVIDWDSCEVADPWLDFFDKGLALYPERQALNAGMIDGYFNGNVPQEFWPYFKALSVFALIQSTIWAINRNDTTYVGQIELQLCNSYENFERDIPIWYEQTARTSSETARSMVKPL